MKKSLHVLLTQNDEASFDAAIRKLVPDLSVIDDCRWPTSTPPIVSSIAACTNTAAYLWSPSVVASLPSIKHPDGVSYQGPASGVVIQLTRSRIDGHILRSGYLSVGFTEPNDRMKKFVTAVWKSLNSIATDRLVTVDAQSRTPFDDKVHMLRAGFDAVAWCQSSSLRAFSMGGPFLVLPEP